MALRRLRDELRSLSLVVALAATAALASAEEGPTAALPKAFGVQDQTRTMLSAFAFVPQTDAGNGAIAKSGSLGRYCWTCPIFGFGAHYYASLDLPSGAVIDSIGVSNETDSDAIMGFTIWERHDDGSREIVYSFRFPAHAGVWQTDFAGSPLSIDDHLGKAYILDVDQQPSQNYQYFGGVEIRWHRRVSPSPATATFADVPTNHPFFQFVEALASSGITGGCGGGNYCPTGPVTRGQMAVFLSKALGLHWPD